MTLARAVAALAVAAVAAFPAVGIAEPICVHPEGWPRTCHDPDHPDCLLYGNMGAESGYQIGEDCPPAYPG